MFSNVAGTYNTAMGASALYYTTGDYNTSVGATSLFYNTSGSYNVAVGSQASARNTTGSYNNSLGYQSLYWNTTGSRNVSIGHQALFSNTTASYNVATGYQALYSNTTGYQNTAGGYQSLHFNSTGYSNTAVGYQSLYLNTTGYANTALGNQALWVNTTGDSNTAIGFGTLLNQTTGNYDTAVGESGLAYCTGSNNTGIGRLAGQVIGNPAVLNNTTVLGYTTVSTASNQVRIGNTSVTSIGGQVGWSTLSDGRFKTDVREDVLGLDFINRLRPVSYTVDKDAIDVFLGIPDSIRQELKTLRKAPGREVGFIAQEVENVVTATEIPFQGVERPQNEKDPYGITYATFVVPLVKAVQELSSKVEEQQKTIDFLLGERKDSTNIGSGPIQGTILYPNNPNPFTIDTKIRMTLSEGAQNARIIVYNLEGNELKSLQVNDRGDTSVTISANEFRAGMYLYTSVVDGKIIDTKRMILTK